MINELYTLKHFLFKFKTDLKGLDSFVAPFQPNFLSLVNPQFLIAILRLLKDKDFSGKGFKIKSGFTFVSLQKYLDFFNLIGKTYSHLWENLVQKEKEQLGIVHKPTSMEDFFEKLHAKHYGDERRYSLEDTIGLLCSAVTSNMFAMFANLKASHFGHPEKDPFKKFLKEFQKSLLSGIATPEISETGSCRKIDFERESRKFSARYIGLIQIFSRIIFYFCGEPQKSIRTCSP